MTTNYSNETTNVTVEGVDGIIKLQGSAQLNEVTKKFISMQLNVYINKPVTPEGETTPVDNWVIAGSANIYQNLNVNMNGNDNADLDFKSQAPAVVTSVLAMLADINIKYAIA